jgi:Bacterial type II secretion system protein N.
LTGRLEFSLQVDDPEIKLTGNAALGLNRKVRFRDLTGRLPLARLGSLTGAASPPLQGIAEFTLRELDVNAAGRPLAAYGVVQLLNLRTTLGQPLNVGDFVVQLDSAGAEGIQGTIEGRQGTAGAGGNAEPVAGWPLPFRRAGRNPRCR